MDERTMTQAQLAKLWRVTSITLVAAVLALAGCSTGGDEPAPTAPSQTAAPSSGDASMVAVRDCMLGAGWEVEIVEQPGGVQGLTGTFPDDQKEQYDLALATCQAESGLSNEPPAMNVEKADEYFDALTETAQCLEGEGIEVPSAPSRQSFIDAATRGEIIWNPYENFFTNDLQMDEFTRVNEACPLPS